MSGLQRHAAHLPDDWDISLPEVPEHLMFVWRCFARLSPGRAWIGGGMGAPRPAPIAWRDLRDWAEFHDLSRGEFATLDRCIRAMDDAYLDWQAARAAAEAAK